MRVCVCLCYPIGLHDKSVVFYLISVGFEIVAATVCCSAKTQFWMTSEAILIPKIYARLQEITSNFSKFSGGSPPDPPLALAPSAPPFQNSWIRPCYFRRLSFDTVSGSVITAHKLTPDDQASHTPFSLLLPTDARLSQHEIRQLQHVHSALYTLHSYNVDHVINYT